MDKNTKKSILSRFKTTSLPYALIMVFTPLFAYILALYISMNVSIYNCVWLIPFIGWLYYRLYFPLHDLSHLNLFKYRKTNYFYGYLISALFAIPFLNFRDEHIAHHKHHGTVNDPARNDYQVSITSKKQFLFFLLNPLIGLSTIKKIKENFLNNERKKIKAFDFYGYISVLLVQTTILTSFVIFSQNGLFYYLIYSIIPGLTFFLFFSRLRQFLEHYPNNHSNQLKQISRTFNLTFFEIMILSSASFKFHHEHHLFPSISSVHLEKINKELQTNNFNNNNYFSMFMNIWYKL